MNDREIRDGLRAIVADLSANEVRQVWSGSLFGYPPAKKRLLRRVIALNKLRDAVGRASRTRHDALNPGGSHG